MPPSEAGWHALAHAGWNVCGRSCSLRDPQWWRSRLSSCPPRPCRRLVQAVHKAVQGERLKAVLRELPGTPNLALRLRQLVAPAPQPLPLPCPALPQ